MSGQTATVTLTVNAPAPDGGGTADIYTGNAAVFPVPSSFVIPAGQTSGSFNVTAGTVMATTPVTVSADYGNSGMGTSVWVVPVTAAATFSAFGISPSTVISAQTATLTFSLSAAAPTGGASIGVGCSPSAAFAVQSPYLIPAGQTSASFTATAGTVALSTPVTCTAGYNAVYQVASVTVAPPVSLVKIGSISVSPAPDRRQRGARRSTWRAMMRPFSYKPRTWCRPGRVRQVSAFPLTPSMVPGT
jgi:hypothetical protein